MLLSNTPLHPGGVVPRRWLEAAGRQREPGHPRARQDGSREAKGALWHVVSRHNGTREQAGLARQLLSAAGLG